MKRLGWFCVGLAISGAMWLGCELDVRVMG